MESATSDLFNDDVKQAAEVIKRGGLILYPTDTVWGIGCDATNPQAVERVYSLKKRADSKSMLAILASTNDLFNWLKVVPSTALMLLEAAVDPLTIIYDSPEGFASNILAPDGSIGIRIPNERFSNALSRKVRRPIVSTSANISGSPTPAIFSDISPEIMAGVDYVVVYRRDDTTRRKPSGIIKVRNDETITIIR